MNGKAKPETGQTVFSMLQDLVEIQVEQPQKGDNYQEYAELENLDGFRFEADIYV